jgi:hypothetical protein
VIQVSCSLEATIDTRFIVVRSLLGLRRRTKGGFMKKFFIVMLVGFVGVAAISIADDSESCAQPGRLAPVCRAMKHIRSHIMILETQRELVQTNFEFLETSLVSLRQSVISLMTGGHANIHIDKMNAVKRVTEKALSEARSHDPEVFKTANQIKVACQQCHNNMSPPGLKWEDIFRTSWNSIDGRCNETEKNPFVCRQMNALVALFDSFESGAGTGRMDFELAAANAQEIQRIVRLLNSFSHPIHEGGKGPLKEVEMKAVEIEELARRRSPLIFEKASSVSQSCIQCHKVQ